MGKKRDKKNQKLFSAPFKEQDPAPEPGRGCYTNTTKLHFSKFAKRGMFRPTGTAINKTDVVVVLDF